jgi:hypothetical protein
MRNGWRVAGLSAGLTAAAMTTACGSGDPAEEAAASSSAALSSAATAAPGTYGQPVDPSLPEPSAVATDAPVTTEPAVPDGDIFLTYSEWNATTNAIEVGGYLDGVVESDGTCTLTTTKGADSAHASAPGISDATSTSCAGLSIPGDQLSSGNWSVVLTYESPASRGSSQPVQVQVP